MAEITTPAKVFVIDYFINWGSKWICKDWGYKCMTIRMHNALTHTLTRSFSCTYLHRF